ncbi:OLC1v1014081C2 [Oldenlandia corymbosa var. corymbosa]|uniref:OLC1v1014081C2 n=1 Tax=Oldenlandia corymbosa var. corymbosa TaxID=529605 RepID=A0AAV1E359_OLDCO|nr:OLC1v1014081C2 [Oldenlandia corymbosa var. corymbosa]
MENKTTLFAFFALLLIHGFCISKGDDDILAPMEMEEKEALYLTIQGFIGKWWNGSDLYPDPCGWTPIQGMSCDFLDGFWHVSVLSIGQVYDNSLNCSPNAEFDSHLFQLKHLRRLSFSNCFLSSHRTASVRIPSMSDWSKLANGLEYLEFRLNPGLTRTIHNAFGCLINLESLVLVENGLTGELPFELGNLVQLKRLVLAGNRFFGQIPASLGGLTELLIFDASRNFLSGPLPITLGGLISLIKLDLSNNQVGGKFPGEIGNLKNLTLADLSCNNFSGGLPESIQEMPSLQELLLSKNPNLGADLMVISWKNLQNLEVLDLSYTGTTGNVPESVSELKQLRFLGLNNNHLSGSIPQSFQSLPSISSLYLDGNDFSGKLEFPEWFYEKMGSRFRVSDNPNLCCTLQNMSSRHVPVGIRTCDQH